MAPKKKGVRKPASTRKSAKTKPRPDRQAASVRGPRHPARKSPQPRVWRRVAKLASDALAALEAGELAEVRGCLEAIRAVGLCAEDH